MVLAGSKIAPCLWFDSQGEEAANFYVSIFKNSRIVQVGRYGKAGFEAHGRPAGTVMLVEFELDGQRFQALNGGPHFKLSEAISLSVYCADQAEVDYFWSKLSSGGGSEGPCGWLKDRFGLSWQVVPEAIPRLLGGGTSDKAQRVFAAIMGMKKIDIATLEKAYAG
jgi:predicted 3-demethylubiquinone-9 3-methyltransferase (glyoxalase superfamily)